MTNFHGLYSFPISSLIYQTVRRGRLRRLYELSRKL
jgi:hypothetical protein